MKSKTHRSFTIGIYFTLTDTSITFWTQLVAKEAIDFQWFDKSNAVALYNLVEVVKIQSLKDQEIRLWLKYREVHLTCCININVWPSYLVFVELCI